MRYYFSSFPPLLFLFCLLLLAGCSPKPGPSGPADEVNPLVGSLSEPKFSHGNTYPSVTLPFGMTAWTPQTGEMGWIYQYQKDRIQGLRATHQPSPWMGDYGQFSVMPMIGPVKVKDAERSSAFRHEKEEAHPYYYRVLLDDQDITAEITPSMRGAMMRFTFPSSDSAVLVWDASAGDGEVRILPEQRQIEGLSRINSGGVPENFACYWVAEFDQEIPSFGTWRENQVTAGSREQVGRDVGAFLRFSGKKVVARVATSFISMEQARKNLREELQGKTFEETKTAARDTWNQHLNKISIEGATEDQRTTFYTAFYRILCFPRVFHEPDSALGIHHYSPYDGQVHEGEMYVDNGFWDTFRAVFPFFSLMFPEEDAAIMRGLVNSYREGDWFPKWTSPGYRDVMIGTHTASLFADAWVKGIRDFDAEVAYEGMVKDALSPSRSGGPGRIGNEYYQRLGYVPSDRIHEATARTLEFAYGDFCVGQMAKALGKEDDYYFFANKAYNYRNVFDPEVGFMRGRLSNGSWRPNFSPSEWGGPFTEGSSWHYTWSVMQDPEGLIALMGGEAAFSNLLDSLFREPPRFEVGTYNAEIHEMTEMVAGNMGQYAHGNQPVHHLIYLYNYARQPWKTQYWTREVMNRLYGPGPDGLAGDEDNGQMSAWYVFSSLGFYPVCPGVPQYVIGSPLFTKATLHLPNGQEFVIEAHNNSDKNRYLQSAVLNGDSLNRSWLWHQDISRGGSLVLEMGDEPNKDWAMEPGSVPFSLSKELSYETLSDKKLSSPVFKSTVARPEISTAERFFRGSQIIRLQCATPGAKIYYTLDGSFPTEEAPVYGEPLLLEASARLNAVARKPGMYKSQIVETHLIRLPHDYQIQLKTAPHPRYNGGGKLALLDGVNGSPNFGDGHWLGFQEKDLEAIVDLGEVIPNYQVGVSFLRNQGAWVFLPQNVEVAVSEDGNTFEVVKSWEEPTPEAEQENEIRSFDTGEIERPARYLRIKAQNQKVCPEWHSGAGGKTWLFVDEISISREVRE